MTDRPILFSAPMVRALLDGRKTQTRRVLKHVPPAPTHDNVVHLHIPHDAPYFDAYCSARRTEANPRGMSDYWCWWTRDDRQSYGCKVGFVPGDRLWVRETWHVRGVYSDVVETGYRASERRGYTEYVEQISVAKAIPGKGTWPMFPKYGPAIHMPRWASRLTLAVTDVRVERLQDISEADAIAEGMEEPATRHFGDPVKAFSALWNSLGRTDETAWDANPWVSAVSFTVSKHNIDEVTHA